MLPPDAASLDEAHAAIQLWEFYKRRRLDPTQRLVVEVMMATRSDGLWAAPTTGREMPRQNGKGDEIEVVELWGLVQRAERILHTVHDAVLLATESQSRLLDGCIEAHADLRRLKARAWRGTGQQMVEMRNGGVIWYRTRTGGGARGVDEVDRIVVDEAQHAEEEHLAAITPTQLASANPQLNAMGSAGIAGKSVWWWRQRKRALSSTPGAFGYVGHTAEDVHLDGDQVVRGSVDVLDRAGWRRANPALATGRAPESFFEEQLARIGPDLFAREHLGVWDPEPGDGAGWGIPASAWQAAERTAMQSRIETHRQWSLAVSPDRKWSSVGLAGRRADGVAHVEFMKRAEGTGWVEQAIVEGWKAMGIPIRIHKDGPEKSFIPTLRERGVEVVEVSTSELGAATGGLIDGVMNGRVVHLDQADLTKALSAAALQMSASGAVVWSQRQSAGEITPLQAVTVAFGGVPDIQPGFFVY